MRSAISRIAANVLAQVILPALMCTAVQAQKQQGGYESLFSYGVGARALGLGGAYIAAPNDASAVYWNPGGLDHLERKTATMFYSNLPGGAQYSFIAYVHPTINIGTFGIGILRVGIGHVLHTGADGYELGEFSHTQTQFRLSYGKRLPLNFAVGVSLKIEQQSFSGGSLTSAVGRGIGADLGVVYTLPFDAGLLQNASIGVTIQNAIQPIIKVATKSEPIPRAYKFGVAKSVQLGPENSHFSLYGDIEIGEKKDPKIHLGTEYAYQGGAMLRVGFSDNALVFGGGAAINLFQIDYSYGKYAQASLLDAVHRFSITIDFGLTKEQIIAAEQRRRDQEIADRVSYETRLRRQVEIQNHIEAGNTLFQQGDFWSAYISFNQAKQLDPENDAAIRGAQLAKARYDEQQKSELERQLARRTADIEVSRKKAYVQAQLDKGISFFEAGQYDQAIVEWEKALTEDPENLIVQNWIAKTRETIKVRITDILRQADRLASRGRYLEALDKYKEAQRSRLLDAATAKRVRTEIAILQNRMNRDDAYQKGVAEYFKKNYADALEYFDQALRLDPKNSQIREFRDKADARANAKDEPFLNDYIKNQFKEAADLKFRKKYREALAILLEIQKQQKYNRDILKLIDEIEEALQQKK